MREQIELKCNECGRINYSTTKDKKKHPERLERKKYCRAERQHTMHREVKK